MCSDNVMSNACIVRSAFWCFGRITAPAPAARTQLAPVTTTSAARTNGHVPILG